MKRKLCFIIAWFCLCSTIAQQNSKKGGENPIVFIDANFGFGNGSADGLVIGYTLNYQFNSNLLTFRNNYLASKNKDRNSDLSRAFIFPAYVQGNSINEYALLYGRRLIFDGSSLSFSAGVSTNNAVYRDRINDVRVRTSINYVGIPYEISFKFFNPDKSRYGIIYGLIPIGRSTAFSRSLGFKLCGSLGKESYLGFGITFGFGWHKIY